MVVTQESAYSANDLDKGIKGEGSGFRLKYLKQPDNYKKDD